LLIKSFAYGNRGKGYNFLFMFELGISVFENKIKFNPEYEAKVKFIIK